MACDSPRSGQGTIEGVKAMSNRRRPSLLGGFLWTGLGILLLLRNLGIGPDFWSLVGRYWPILLILLGLGKVIDYFTQKDAVSIRVGEIVGILLLLLIGSAITKWSGSHVGQMVRDLPIEIGGTSVRPGQWIGESHTYTEEAAYPLAYPIPISIENSYGTVSIARGNQHEVRVRLKKVIYGDESHARKAASEIHIEAGEESASDPSATLKAEAEPGQESGSVFLAVRNNREALTSKGYRFNTDMEIFVPSNSEVQVRNTYGEVKATDIDGSFDFGTTHRAIEVRDCAGQFMVSTRYAECRLTNLVGNLEVDGRGGVYIENIKGDVNVTDEYSPVEISRVDGKITVSNTEGSIRIEKVTQPVVINARGTRVRAEGLQDNVKVIASHRSVDISNVAADVSIESSYAAVTLKDIKGNVTVTSNSDRFSVDDVSGHIRMMGRGSGIQVNDVGGPLDINTTLKDVLVNGFGASCNITNEYANVSVSAPNLSGADVHIKNRNGRIDLFLPEGAAFSISATARNGKVESAYRGLANAGNAGNMGVLKSRVKTGGPRILLETDNADIHLRSLGSEQK